MSRPSKVRATLAGREIAVAFPYSVTDLEAIKEVPRRRWDKKKGVWWLPADEGCLAVLKDQFGDRLIMCQGCQDILSGLAMEVAEAAAEVKIAKLAEKIDTSMVPRDLIRPTCPVTGRPQALMTQQLEALALGGRRRAFGYLLDQGLGKTPTAIADAVWAYRRGSIDTLIVVCLNNVKPQWVCPDGSGEDEVTKFVPEDIPLNTGVLLPSKGMLAKRKVRWERFLTTWTAKTHLNVLAINFEALDGEWEWLLKRVDKRTMIVFDESTNLKALPKRNRRNGAPQNRSAKALKIRERCGAARIMSGTPIIKRPLDAWTQILLLDKQLLPWASHSSFRNEICVTGSYNNILWYKDDGLDRLSEVINGCTYRLTKEEAKRRKIIDIPDKVYAPLNFVEMTKNQREIYDAMKKECLVILDQQAKIVNFDALMARAAIEGDSILDADDLTMHEAPIVLTQILRLQQIAGGYLPEYGEPGPDGKRKVVSYQRLVEPDKNPKFRRAFEIVEASGDQKCVIWSAFRPEIEDFCWLLGEAGIEFVPYHGGVSEDDRLRGKRRFMKEPGVHLVGNPAAGGTGLNLQAGSIMAYISNRCRTEHRVQSEDRIHRIGQHLSTTFHDIIAAPIDMTVLKVLRDDRALSAKVLGDDPLTWF